MNAIDKILTDSIYEAISKTQGSNEQEFYTLLRDKYKLTFGNISQSFNSFHIALKETYGLQHYSIEREIISTMHKNTNEGKYQLTDEITAFSIVTKTITDDNKQDIEKMKKTLEEGQQKTQNDKNVKELKQIERNKRFLAKIEESQKIIEEIFRKWFKK